MSRWFCTDFGFATDETFSPGPLFDSFSVTLRDDATLRSAIYLSADASGVAWAPAVVWLSSLYEMMTRPFYCRGYLEEVAAGAGHTLTGEFSVAVDHVPHRGGEQADARPLGPERLEEPRPAEGESEPGRREGAAGLEGEREHRLVDGATVWVWAETSSEPWVREGDALAIGSSGQSSGGAQHAVPLRTPQHSKTDGVAWHKEQL